MKRKNYIQALEELLKDKARLDRLQKATGHLSFVDDRWSAFFNDETACGRGEGKTVREAIDEGIRQYDEMADPKLAEFIKRHSKPAPKTAPQPRKPLFIPLKAQYFDAFKDGRKTVEYRPNGKRWNQDTCIPGRKVILSRGYSGARIEGVIKSIHFDNLPGVNIPGWREIYGNDAGQAICITITLDPSIGSPCYS